MIVLYAFKASVAVRQAKAWGPQYALPGFDTSHRYLQAGLMYVRRCSVRQDRCTAVREAAAAWVPLESPLLKCSSLAG